MKRTAFNAGWQVREKVSPFDEASAAAAYQDVTLPHDALILRERNAQGRSANAYFPSATVQYRKSFVPTPGAPKTIVEFEGVYRDALVYINGAFAGQRPSGYAGFTVDLTPYLEPDIENEILVEARVHEDSRWYTGAGIYRDVWLLEGDAVHVTSDGLHVTTPDIEDGMAVVEIAAELITTSARLSSVRVNAQIRSTDGEVVATGTTVVSAPPGRAVMTRQRLYVSDPSLWSAESPTLYVATVSVLDGDDLLDEVETAFGIRSLQLDPRNGLRVNGETVKLRGTCIHQDNGILGAATFASSEERQVRRLKDAGFNAIRSAHNPINRAMLDACDRLGVYVMDEAFDMWASTKSGFDYGLAFPTWWRADLRSMVIKDRNHPSVIMYSIGNEIPEVGTPAGALLGRELAEELRSLDPARFVTNGVNGLLAVMNDLKKLSIEHGPAGAMEAIGINTMMAASGGDYMNLIGTSDLVSEKTEESFAVLDVAGLNYLQGRYESDATRFPQRIIVGTETFPKDIDENWALVSRLDHVIGDFTWTGWDYLGEVGIGRAVAKTPDDQTPDLTGPFPWITAWCGDIDLIGYRRPVSYYREIVFGLRREPYIAVVRPGSEAPHGLTSSWAWSDSLSTWSWSVDTRRPLVVEVYSDADEVELILNGESLGRRSAGPQSRFRAEFTVGFEPGELVAVAHRNGAPAERHSLRSAQGALSLGAQAEQGHLAADAGELGFVEIELVDENGDLWATEGREISVEVSGAGRLKALGTGNPATDVPYDTATVATFDGRALAIVEPLGSGEIRVTVTAEGHASAALTLIAS